MAICPTCGGSGQVPDVPGNIGEHDARYDIPPTSSPVLGLGDRNALSARMAQRWAAGETPTGTVPLAASGNAMRQLPGGSFVPTGAGANPANTVQALRRLLAMKSMKSAPFEYDIFAGR